MAEVEIAMPKLSDSMEQATVLSWLKRPGDAVRRGEPLVEVETDKATVVYEAEESGILGEIVVDEGGTAALGAVIARLVVDGSSVSRAETPTVPVTAAAFSTSSAMGHRDPAPHPTATRARATPVARRLATQLGVSLSGIGGSGPGGRIVGADVRRLAGAREAVVEHDRGEIQELAQTPTQRTIAERMTLSRSTIPEFTVEVDASMEAVARVREDFRFGDVTPLPTWNDFVVRAVALTLREHRVLNAGYEDRRVRRFGRINIGIAVAIDDGLIVPTIYDADRKSVLEIAVESRRLAERARSRSLSPDELANGTFTVSNLGMFGVRRFNAVINHPQAAILAVGEVAERPVVESGQLRVGTMMELALSCDHRVVYGADAARFLGRLREFLEHPALLFHESSVS
jgi:pyruvate dehydrogenase E2 component (dihydrolipoyllysine-residue acetyltransferase)